MINIRQLAALAGVSIGTVSLALRDNARISQETRQRIQQLALQYHYLPNRLTEGLISGKTRTIGCILPNVTCTFYARILRGVLDRAFETSYHIITLETHSKLMHTCKAIHEMVARRVDGILVSSEHPAMIPRETVQEMLRHNVWPVSIDNTQFEEPVDAVKSDEITLAQMMVDYLYDLGHRKIAYVGDIPGGKLYDRSLNIAKAMRLHGLPTTSFIDAFTDDLTNLKAESIVTKILSIPTPPTAVICWEDRAAMKLLPHFNERGLRIPRDISILGCANMDAADFANPRLTSVEQFPEEIGKQALDLIISRSMTGQDYTALSPKTITIPVKFVKRDSCGPCLPQLRRQVLD